MEYIFSQSDEISTNNSMVSKGGMFLEALHSLEYQCNMLKILQDAETKQLN